MWFPTQWCSSPPLDFADGAFVTGDQRKPRMGFECAKGDDEGAGSVTLALGGVVYNSDMISIVEARVSSMNSSGVVMKNEGLGGEDMNILKVTCWGLIER
ncbi:hypothetical protein V6N12_050776 [Hibiscus sabdariffa]|uniref:Uncharacterized protein n=1 Tax=Hibiscus sabdariffa TaxID=183260 RepID=A0ABR2GEJ6_9ROSI